MFTISCLYCFKTVFFTHSSPRFLQVLVFTALALLPKTLLAENVIFLSSAYVTGPWQRALDQEIAASIASRHGELRVYREDLSYITRKPQIDAVSLAQRLNEKYDGLEVSRLVAVGGHAHTFIETAGDQLLPGAVKYLVSDYKVIELKDNQESRVLKAGDIPTDSISLIKSIFPGVRKVVLVSSYPNQRETLQGFQAVDPALEVELWGAGLSYKEVLERASKLQPGSVIHYHGMPSDSRGQQKVVADFAAELAKASPQPVFASFATTIGRGVLGGSVAEPRETGKRVGQLLTGTFVPGGSMLATEIDYETMQRFDIEWDQIPPNATVLNTPLEFMEDPVALTRYGLALTLLMFMALAALMMRMLLVRARAKRAEAHAEELRQEKRKSQKLYGVIAHELRTPVSAISMMAAESDDEFCKRKSDIRNATESLLTTIDDMSLMVDPNLERPIRNSSFNLSEFNKDIASSVASLIASSGMQFSYDEDESVSGSAALYVADTYRIRVAITNLIRNSCLHSEGSRVSLKSRITERNGSLIGEWMVCDDGSGIAPEDVERIFNEGERSKSPSQGSGLGLYITRTWIGEISGEVTYDPADEAGSCFSLSVPLQTAEAQTREPALSSDDAVLHPTEHFKVLLVEDEVMLRMLGEKLLSNFVSQVEVAADGAEGLAKFDPTFDLVLADYFMPTMTGAEMIKEIRASGYEGMIVGVTAATIGDQMQEMRSVGADAVIEKPLTAEKFKVTVQKLLTERHSKADDPKH